MDNCYNCYSYEYCPYLAVFNINKDLGCIDWLDKNFQPTIASTTTEININWLKEDKSK